jgi:hypothetical protein
MSAGWKTLEQAIPRGTAAAIAHKLHLAADYVRRWRREALGDDAPLASGQRSPLDRVCDLIDAVFLINPRGTVLIVEHVRKHYEGLIETHALESSIWNRRQDAAAALREAVEAVNCLNLDSASEETERELVEARDAFDRALVQLRGARLRK